VDEVSSGQGVSGQVNEESVNEESVDEESVEETTVGKRSVAFGLHESSRHLKFTLKSSHVTSLSSRLQPITIQQTVAEQQSRFTRGAATVLHLFYLGRSEARRERDGGSNRSRRQEVSRL